jgi:hypothetical protein
MAAANVSGKAVHRHEKKDQPDVVGLPHRADAVIDQGAHRGTMLRPAGGGVEEAGPEVRATEHRVGHNACEQHGRDGQFEASCVLRREDEGAVRTG